MLSLSLSPPSAFSRKQTNPEIENRAEMSVLSSSLPSIKIKTIPSSNFSSSKPFTFIIKCSQADGPLRRPSAPLSPPSTTNSGITTTQSPPPLKAVESAVAVGVTFEYQRKMAKEMQDYFRQKKLEEAADRGPFFGFIAKNEISNGRWAMFGFAVGFLTEYATGSDFVQQLKILFSNFGIVDLD